MRIVYLSSSAFPSRRASSIQVMRMCEAFAQNGHETTLMGKQFGRRTVADIHAYYGVQKNFDLVFIPCAEVKGVTLFVLPWLYAHLRRYDPKKVLIYARDVYSASLAVRMGFRVIYETHTVGYNALIRHLEGAILRNPRLIRLVVISEALKRLYVSRFSVCEKLVVCHDGATLPNGSWNGDLPWPVCRNTLQIGYTGHLYPGKGVEIIVECAKRLTQYDFHVIGGTDSDIAYWKGRAAHNLHFHGFFEPRLMHAVRSHCDVLLMPYQRQVIVPHSHVDISSYMSPLKLFEYMASQRAIIASDLPVLREVLDDRMAVLVSPDVPEEWVGAIARCEKPEYRDTLARNAYDAFCAYHTWEKRALRVLDGVVL